MITRFQGGHAFAHLNHNACTFMAENSRENPLRVRARAGKFIRMANACGFDFHQDLARLRAVQFDLHHGQWFARF